MLWVKSLKQASSIYLSLVTRGQSVPLMSKVYPTKAAKVLCLLTSSSVERAGLWGGKDNGLSKATVEGSCIMLWPAGSCFCLHGDMKRGLLTTCFDSLVLGAGVERWQDCRGDGHLGAGPMPSVKGSGTSGGRSHQRCASLMSWQLRYGGPGLMAVI